MSAHCLHTFIYKSQFYLLCLFILFDLKYNKYSIGLRSTLMNYKPAHLYKSQHSLTEAFDLYWMNL